MRTLTALPQFLPTVKAAVEISAMESDKVFNLQLTIQKLQEEVSLYRNGADGEEIFQLIAEKESEIKVLKVSIVSKNENLRKLAKKSSEVLARCDRVQSEYETLQFEHSDLIQEKKTLQTAVEEIKSLNCVIAAKCEEKSVAIIQLEHELATREESIEKLQSRCAALISQKNDKVREYEKENRDNAADKAEKNSNIKELTVSPLHQVITMNQPQGEYIISRSFFSYEQ